jgi:hypothetical protein
MIKIFDAWCDQCKQFTSHIKVFKNGKALIKCLDCKKWTKI